MQQSKMIFFVILLFPSISLCNVITSNVTELKMNSTYIFQSLQSKNITCDLHDFIVKTDDTDNDYKLFLNDLNNFCSDAQTNQVYRLLCRMLTIEFELACLLPNNSRPSPVKYTLPYTAKKICQMNKINLTNYWMWEKLSVEEREKVATTPTQLCPTITATEEVLLLVKFFYKIAPRIRRADQADDAVLNTNSSNNQTDKNNLHAGWMEQEEKSTNLTVVNGTNNIQEEILPKLTINQTLMNTTDVKQNQSIVNETPPSPVDLEKVNKTENITNRSEGLPLGRVGEKPEREQNNERPKPKVLDVESVFKVNENDKKNWVEGENLPNESGDNFNAHGLKPDDNLAIPPGNARRKSPFRLKSNRQNDRRDEDFFNENFFTSFLIFILCIVIVYLILHNKNKVLGLIIEGCKRRRVSNSRRPTHRHTRLSQSAN